MKLFPVKFRRRFIARAFTIVEIMIALSVFTLVVAAMVSSQMLGLKINSATAAKMISTSGSRHAMDLVRETIKGGNALYIGSWSGTNFLIQTNGLLKGPALKVCTTNATYPYYVFYLYTTGTNELRYYFYDGVNAATIRSMTGNIGGDTNVFFAENFQGIVQSNTTGNRTIRMALDFYQREFVTGPATTASNYYHMQMRVTQRNLDD